MFIPDSLIATSEILKRYKISEGDEVFFSGLFTSHPGQKKNQPIVRFGRVALMSDEKIEWREKDKAAKFLDLYLVECQSFGGNKNWLLKLSPKFLFYYKNNEFLNILYQLVFIPF